MRKFMANKEEQTVMPEEASPIFKTPEQLAKIYQDMDVMVKAATTRATLDGLSQVGTASWSDPGAWLGYDEVQE